MDDNSKLREDELDYDPYEGEVENTLTFKVSRKYSGVTGTWTVLVNDHVLMECLSKSDLDSMSDLEMLYWYARAKGACPKSDRC